VLGDWDGNGTLSTADIAAMLTALTDLNVYSQCLQDVEGLVD
jgi:hypothetical protein